MKWNESSFRPRLCKYRLNWVRRTSWGWWDEWDDTVLQTQDSKFEPWRSEAEHTTFWSRRLPRFTRGWGRNIFVSFKPPRPETEPRTLAWKAAVLTTTLGPPPNFNNRSAVYKKYTNMSYRTGGEWRYVVKHSNDKGDRGKTSVITITWQTCLLSQTFIIFLNGSHHLFRTHEQYYKIKIYKPSLSGHCHSMSLRTGALTVYFYFEIYKTFSFSW